MRRGTLLGGALLLLAGTAPAVAHQTRAYTAKALRDYRANARPSVGVAAMNEAAGGLTDDDITALAVFLEQPQ